ncbi:MAG: ion transporter [Verrucomicrobiota bacterium]
MVNLCKTIEASRWFHASIIAIIILAGIVIGLETYPGVAAKYGTTLHILDQIILWIFVVEIVIKMVSRAPQPWTYFKDGWNVFDFTIVAICFLPINAEYVAVLRLARILRVLRLVTVLPQLQLLVGALIRSIPSMGYVSLLLGLLFYVYGVTGTILFGQNDPIHFGSLQTSMLTLFQLVTLEGWVEIMNTQTLGADKFGYEGQEHLIKEVSRWPVTSPVYFISFILLGTMVMLNLFIGVIMNGMQETQMEQQEQQLRQLQNSVSSESLTEELSELTDQMDQLRQRLEALKKRIQSD